MDARGLTLIEVVIAASLAAVITLAAYGSLESATQAARTTQATSRLEESGRGVLDRIASDLRQTSLWRLSVNSGPASTTVACRPVEGAGAGEPIFGAPVVYSDVYDAADPDNGKDDDRDGLIDEMEIVRTAGASTAAILVNVREGSFRVTWSGSALLVSFELQALDDDRRLVTRPFQTLVQPRN